MHTWNKYNKISILFQRRIFIKGNFNILLTRQVKGAIYTQEKVYTSFSPSGSLRKSLQQHAGNTVLEA